jgi:hypothetical protein
MEPKMNVCISLASSPLKVHEAMRGHIFYLSPFISDHHLPCHFKLPGFIFFPLTVLCRNALFILADFRCFDDQLESNK